MSAFEGSPQIATISERDDRYQVRSALEIGKILRGLIAHRALVTAHAGEHGAFFVTAILEVDDDEGWRERPPTLSDKLRLLFDALYPDVTDVTTESVWCAGELLRYGGNFNQYVKARDPVKQEGIVFRHLLRLILLCGEFMEVCPEDTTPEEWRADLRDLTECLTASCREVDPTSTDQMIQRAHAADVV
jgi:hypothetical protein